MSKRETRHTARAATPTAAASADSAPRTLPLKFMLTSAAATVNFTAGMVGLAFPREFPALGLPAVTVTLIAVGVGLEIWAIRQLLATRRPSAGVSGGARRAAKG